MKSYMVDIDLLANLDIDFWKLIPAQKAFVNRMMKSGLISDYSLSIDKQKLWVIITASTKEKAIEVVDSFPIAKYMKYEVYNLLFHERNSIAAPQLWLN